MEATASQIAELIRPFKGQTGATIPILQAIQTSLGYLPPESFDLIEQETGIPASKASIFVNLIPVFTVILGWLILDERFTGAQYLASALVFIGIYVSQRTTSATGPSK